MLILGAIVGVGIVLYKAFGIGKAGVDAASGAIADLWLKLSPLPAAMQLLGTVRFPGNLRVPLQTIGSANVRQDANHNVFVKYSGLTWQLAPQVNGEWPATRVS